MWLIVMQYVFALAFGLLGLRDIAKIAASGPSDRERRYKVLRGLGFFALGLLFVIFGEVLAISSALGILVE